MTLIAKRHALFGEQSGLRIPARNEPPRMVDDAVTGEIPIQLGAVQNAADETRVFRSPDERGDLAVGRDTSGGDLAYDG